MKKPKIPISATFDKDGGMQVQWKEVSEEEFTEFARRFLKAGEVLECPKKGVA